MKQPKPWEAEWEIVGHIGSGGQGSVQLVRRKGDPGEIRYALKTLNRSGDTERRRRMYREVASLKTLDIPSVPKLVASNFDRFEEEVPLFLVSEYIPGSTLEAVVKAAPASSEASLQLMKQLLDTLEYCHARNVLHRDIKPDNIVLRDADLARPVLLDFGQSFNDEAPEIHVTGSEQQLGNRFLALPELLSLVGGNRDRRSDITSCVGVLFFAVTGVYPLTLLDEAGRKPHERQGVQARLQSLPREQRERLQTAFDLGFEVNIDQRWQTVQSLRQALDVTTSSFDTTRAIEQVRRELALSPQFSLREKFVPLVGRIFKRVAVVHTEIGKAFPEYRFFSGEQHVELGQPLRGMRAFGFMHRYGTKPVNAVFYVTVEGSEAVVIVDETSILRNHTEIFREPLATFDHAKAFEGRVSEHFLSLMRIQSAN